MGRLGPWLREHRVVLIIVAAAVAIAAAGPAAGEWLRYDRGAIIQHGQWWRLFTGNFVHLGWPHLSLDLAGLVLVWLLFRPQIAERVWAIATVFCSLGVGVGLLWRMPDLQWYVGLSGMLHGLFVAGALLCIRQGYRFELLMIALVVGKLVWEHTMGPLPGSEHYSGGHVVVQAHLYGAVSGALLGLLLPLRWAVRRPAADAAPAVKDGV